MDLSPGSGDGVTLGKSPPFSGPYVLPLPGDGAQSTGADPQWVLLDPRSPKHIPALWCFSEYHLGAEGRDMSHPTVGKSRT